MAVDSRNKRFSIMGLTVVTLSVLPNPDGGIDTAAERQQHIWLYSGIDADSPVPVPDTIVLQSVALGAQGALTAPALTQGALDDLDLEPDV